MQGPSKRWLYWIVIFTVIGYIGARQFNAEEYPDDWPSPAIFAGWRGGCPNLAGEYDGVDHRIPRMLKQQPEWERGIRPWFEHKAKVEQSSNGSTLRITFALNERGLPKHRDHVLQHGSAWPSGHSETLELNRKDHYDCSMRWLTLDTAHDADTGESKNGRVRLSVDRQGNLVLGYTKQEWTSFGVFFGQSIGPTWKTDKTRWVRWTKRPKEADAALAAVQSLSVTRLKRHAVHGPQQLIALGNFTGGDVCARLWDQAGPDPDAPRAGIRNSAGFIGMRKRMPGGSIVTEQPCPEGWEVLRATQVQNYFVYVTEGAARDYRVAWRPLAEPDAEPARLTLGDVTALPAPWEALERPALQTGTGADVQGASGKLPAP